MDLTRKLVLGGLVFVVGCAPVSTPAPPAARPEPPGAAAAPTAGTTKVTPGKVDQGTSDIECEVPFAGPGLTKVKTTVEPDCVTRPDSELAVRWRGKTLSVLTIEKSLPLKGDTFDSEVFEQPPRGARLALHFKAKCVGSTELTQGIGRCRMP